MADEKKHPEPPSESKPQKTPDSEKNADRDGGERQPSQHKNES